MLTIQDISEASKPGVYSKSNFDLSSISKICNDIQLPVLYITFDDINEVLINGLAKHSTVSVAKIAKGLASPDDWKRLVDASKKMQKADLYLKGNISGLDEINAAISEGVKHLNIEHVFVSGEINALELDKMAAIHDVKIIVPKA